MSDADVIFLRQRTEPDKPELPFVSDDPVPCVGDGDVGQRLSHVEVSVLIHRVLYGELLGQYGAPIQLHAHAGGDIIDRHGLGHGPVVVDVVLIEPHTSSALSMAS